MDTVEGRYSSEQLFEFYKPNTGPIEIPTGKGITYNFPEIPKPPKHPYEKQQEKLAKKAGDGNLSKKVWFSQGEHKQPSTFWRQVQLRGQVTSVDEDTLFNSLWKKF